MKLHLARFVRRFLSLVVRHASADTELYLREAGIDVDAITSSTSPAPSTQPAHQQPAS